MREVIKNENEDYYYSDSPPSSSPLKNSQKGISRLARVIFFSIRKCLSGEVISGLSGVFPNSEEPRRDIGQLATPASENSFL